MQSTKGKLLILAVLVLLVANVGKFLLQSDVDERESTAQSVRVVHGYDHAPVWVRGLVAESVSVDIFYGSNEEKDKHARVSSVPKQPKPKKVEKIEPTLQAAGVKVLATSHRGEVPSALIKHNERSKVIFVGDVLDGKYIVTGISSKGIELTLYEH